MDLEAIEIGVPGGVGDLGGAHVFPGLLHGGGVAVPVAVGIQHQHGGNALGDGAGGHHHDLPVLNEAHALLGGHDDVLVVGQDEHRLGGGAGDLPEDVLGGGVHGLPAGDDAVRPQIAEHGGHARPGAHCHHAELLLRRRDGGPILLGLQLRLDLLQIVGALGLPARGQLLGLGAHILDLRQLQGAVLLGLAQGRAGGVGVDVDLERLVVLADDQAVPDAVQIGPEGLDGLARRLAHDEHGVEGKGDVLLGQGGKVGGLLHGQAVLGTLRGGDAPQLVQHSLEYHQEALAPRVHHPGLFQHRVLVHRVRQGDLALGDGGLQHGLHAVVLPGGLRGLRGGQAGDGEDGALGGLHHRLVGGGHAVVEGGGKGRAVGGVPLLQPLGHAPEQQGQDHAGVPPGPPQQGGGVGGGGLPDGLGGLLPGLGGGGADGEGHIGARVPVGDGEHVQLVDGLLLGVDGGGGVHNHALEQRAVNDIYHNRVILSFWAV